MTSRWINYLALTMSAVVSAASAYGLGLLQPSRHSTPELSPLDVTPLDSQIHERVSKNDSQPDSEASLIGSLKEAADKLDKDLFVNLEKYLKSSSTTNGSWRKLLPQRDIEKELNDVEEALKHQLSNEESSDGLRARAKKWSDSQNPPSAYLTAGKPDRFKAEQEEFVWVDGFWITAKEIPDGREKNLMEMLETKLGDLGYSVGKPTKDQWIRSREAAIGSGLSDFDSGLGEKLNDGTIIGISSDFPNSKENPTEALKLADRQARTRYTTTEQLKKGHSTSSQGGARFGGNSTDSAKKEHNEEKFATRLVVIPNSRE